MEKLNKTAIIGGASEGASLARVVSELEAKGITIQAANEAKPSLVDLAVEKPVKKQHDTHKMINGVMHYLTVAGEWKPMLYTTKKDVTANE